MSLTDYPKTIAALTVVGTIACKALLDRWRTNVAKLPYPPGPPPRPIIGNLFDVPTSYGWRTYTEWGKQYGDIMHINILGEHVIIVNSLEMAVDLLDKRSGNYSDRPKIPVMDINGWDINMGLKQYNDEWRRDRKILHDKFRRQLAPNLYPLETAKAHSLLHDLLRAPKNFTSHYEMYPASIIMYILYGHEISSAEDPLVKITFETLGMFGGAVVPGSNIINVFPSLRHLPTWTPGLRALHDLCARCRSHLKKMQEIPFASVKKHMEHGTAVPSWVSELIEQNEQGGKEHIPDNVIKALGAITFGAAMETTLAALRSFTLAMILFPETQDRAQAEIDSVIGNQRLPTFDDRPSLPYLDALYREVMRWRGPAPSGVPHAVTEDDVYQGYFIPKGAIIMPNQWAMCHDERVYPNPSQFKPDRFLTTEGTLTDSFPPTFGFGRRICAGQSLADNTLWIAFASILSVFRISKAINADGRSVEVTTDYTDGIVSAPFPFECSILPRSEAARQLILVNPPIKLHSNPMHY